MSIQIRPESPSDAAAIEAVIAAAFLHAPHTDHNEPFIVNALRRAGQLSVSLVADDVGAVVGHIAISPVTTSDGAAGWYGLGPLAVVPDRQRHGIGSRLTAQALSELRRIGAAGCVVLGDPGYYGRFGFRVEPSLVLPGVPPEYFQALVFRGPLPRGTVTYHEAFAARA